MAGEPRAMHCVSVVTVERLPAARAMAASLAKHHPGWTVDLALVATAARAAREGDPRIRSVEQLLEIDVEQALTLMTTDQLAAALVPRALRELGAGRPRLHLPASAWVLGPLEFVERALARAPVMLAPRARIDPPDDGLRPSADDLRRWGYIAPELLAVDGSPESEGFLTWSIARCDHTLGAPDGSVAALTAEPERWLGISQELAAARVDLVSATESGSVLSVWNMHEHPVETADPQELLGGRPPLRLLDLPGFDPDRPSQLNRWAPRARVRYGSALAQLTIGYAAALRDAGWADAGHHDDIGGRLPDGTEFDERLAEFYAVACATGVDPGDPIAEPRFADWLRGPARRGGAAGVNRYAWLRVSRERHDVVDAFPDLDGGDGPRLVQWCRTSGREEMGLPETLMPAPPATGALPGQGGDAAATSVATAPPASGTLGVRVSGYMGHVLGLGAAARGYAEALGAAGVPVSTATVSLDHQHHAPQLGDDYGRHEFEDLAGEHEISHELICVNPDELPAFVAAAGADHFRGRRIGVWGWETTSIPARWQPAFDFIDEIWVYSRFVADSFAAVTDTPVIALPPPVAAPPQDLAPDRLGIPDGFLFYFAFDYSSTIQRKNPVGLIRAFTEAFAPGEGPRLLVKSLNGPRFPAAAEEVRWAAGDRPDVHLLDRSLSTAQRDALMLACDCYVSLHRSEGFGLTMAEAMSIGRPVIATGYSGNVDFMDGSNSYLVDYALTRVGPDVQIYPPDGEWAEPDLTQAAVLMRRVYEDRADASARGERARREIAERLSPRTTGAAMRRRLERVEG